MTRGRAGLFGLLVLIAVVALVAGGCGGSDVPGAGPGPVAAVPSAPAPEAVAPMVRAEDLPDLRGQLPQQDIARDAPSVRAYERTHRLLDATPLTFRGVTFVHDSGSPNPRRIAITARPNGLGPTAARRAYRAVLRSLGDTGRAYVLRIAGHTAPHQEDPR